jgi:hypothetical protein
MTSAELLHQTVMLGEAKHPREADDRECWNAFVAECLHDEEPSEKRARKNQLIALFLQTMPGSFARSG